MFYSWVSHLPQILNYFPSKLLGQIGWHFTSMIKPYQIWIIILKHQNNEDIKLHWWLSGRAFAPEAGGCGFNPLPRHTKDIIKMAPDAFLRSPQHIRIGLVSSFKPYLKKSESCWEWLMWFVIILLEIVNKLLKKVF